MMPCPKSKISLKRKKGKKEGRKEGNEGQNPEYFICNLYAVIEYCNLPISTFKRISKK